jgi:hypothetical protein
MNLRRRIVPGVIRPASLRWHHLAASSCAAFLATSGGVA